MASARMPATAGRSAATRPAAKKSTAGTTGRKKPVAKKAVAKKAVAKKAVAKKAVAKKAVAKKAVAKKAVARKPVAKHAATATRQAASRKPATSNVKARPASRPAGAGQAKRAPRAITPKQALANTRKLLEAKQAHDRQPPPWQALDSHPEQSPHAAGFQSGQAQARAEALHAGESRMEAIQGAIGTQDRHHQGKRDQR